MMIKAMRYLFTLSLICFLAIQSGFSQTTGTEPVYLVDSSMQVWQYHSRVIGDDYTIYVSLPSAYDSTKTYPVLYMTDGDWNMHLAQDCFSMLEQDYTTVTPVIVGIGYGNRENHRARDYEPKTGGPKFFSFLQTELMPFIESRYHSNGNNALFGYSYGGVFASYVLFEHSGIFNTVLMGAPGNGGGEITTLTSSAQNFFSTHEELRCNVFAGVGAYEPEKVANVKDFDTYLKSKKLKTLHCKTVIVPGVAHGAALAPVMQSAFKFAYCELHSAITLPVAGLMMYTGNYRIADNPKLQLKAFVRDNDLFLQVGNIKTMQLVPYGKDKFFMYEDEHVDVSFKNEGGKKYFLFTTLNQKPQRIDKIN